MVHRELITVIGLAAAIVASAALHAHDVERTRVVVTFDEDGTFRVDVANDPDWLLLRLAPFAGEPLPPGLTPAQRDARLTALAPLFAERVVAAFEGRPVPVGAEYLPPQGPAPRTETPPQGIMRVTGRVPTGARAFQFTHGLVIDPYPMTVHAGATPIFAGWVEGDLPSEVVLLEGRLPQTRWARVAARYFRLGFVHILPRGLDHILFVLGVFLLSFRLRPILLQVTAFTIAHSITLALTMYGIVSLAPGIVEPLIALSIVYVALENLMTRELTPWRLGLVFGFGLLHGMGFAGVLAELGLPRSQFVTALVTFNLGVEAGQLAVVAMAFAALAWYRHREWYHRRVVVPASAVIAGVGTYWAIVRMAGIN